MGRRYSVISLLTKYLAPNENLRNHCVSSYAISQFCMPLLSLYNYCIGTCVIEWQSISIGVQAGTVRTRHTRTSLAMRSCFLFIYCGRALAGVIAQRPRKAVSLPHLYLLLIFISHMAKGVNSISLFIMQMFETRTISNSFRLNKLGMCGSRGFRFFPGARDTAFGLARITQVRMSMHRLNRQRSYKAIEKHLCT